MKIKHVMAGLQKMDLEKEVRIIMDNEDQDVFYKNMFKSILPEILESPNETISEIQNKLIMDGISPVVMDEYLNINMINDAIKDFKEDDSYKSKELTVMNIVKSLLWGLGRVDSVNCPGINVSNLHIPSPEDGEDDAAFIIATENTYIITPGDLLKLNKWYNEETHDTCDQYVNFNEFTVGKLLNIFDLISTYKEAEKIRYTKQFTFTETRCLQFRRTEIQCFMYNDKKRY